MSIVSIILPVYNANAFLKQAIESIINQTFSDFELIIINDGSTDESKKIILSFHDNRIKYFENEINLGLIKTLNKGINLCKGKYIVRMDADDICEPDRLEKQFNFMERHPKIGVCGSWATVIDEKNQPTGKIINQTDPDFISIHLLFSVPLIHPSTFFRSEILQNNLYAEVILAEDYELWCRLNEQTNIANIPLCLLRYRWHGDNISYGKKGIQEKNKEDIISNELLKLGIETDKEMLRIHRLSFSFYELGKKMNPDIQPSDLKTSELWFARLLARNKQIKRYNQDAFIAFLWGRWIVLCLQFKQKGKIFFPSFASYKPQVLLFLFKQLQLMKKKQ